MFWRLLFGSLRHGTGRLAVGFLAIALGASLVSGLFNLSFQVGPQVGRELRDYGANLVVLPRGFGTGGPMPLQDGLLSEGGIPETDLDALRNIDGVVDYAPYVYLVGNVESRPVIVAGTTFGRARAMSPWWHLGRGRWPKNAGDALVGTDAARALGAEPGRTLDLRYGTVRRSVTIVGVLESGGAEDGQILVTLPDAQQLAGTPGEVGMIQVSALAEERPIRDIAAAIQDRVPNVEADAVGQFTQAEADLLGKVRRLVALVALLVLVVAALTVASTMATRMLERREEIGLWKALGATHRRVMTLFLGEALGMGLFGGLVGYLGGVALAMFIGTQVFGVAPALTKGSLPFTLAVAVGAAMSAGFWPVRRALAQDITTTMQGE